MKYLTQDEISTYKMNTLVSIKNLKISFRQDDRDINIIDDVSFDIQQGEIFALVGESGCGKTVTSLAITRLLPKSITRFEGAIIFDDKNILTSNDEDMRRLRGGRVAYIFQEPATSLNPVMSIKEQLVEIIILHQKISASKALNKAIEALNEVGISDARTRIGFYPHQLSGGQRQRVMIAMALSCNPKLLIADEPTTALDVTIQAQILFLLKELNRKLGLSILLITHDLSIVRRIADRIAIMRKGKILEVNSTEVLFNNPQSSYTRALLSCSLTMTQPKKRLPTIRDFISDEE